MTVTDNPLASLRDVDGPTLQRLRDALAEKAAEAQLLDLAYRRVDSPLGSLLLVATERGLIRVAFASQDHDRVLDQLAGTISPRVLEAPRRLDPAARELDEYFAGARHDFDLPLDLTTTGEFRRAVRAVVTACATNPLPVVVPCHRVLRGDGSLGGYLGGLEAKRTLLDLEAGLAA